MRLLFFRPTPITAAAALALAAIAVGCGGSSSSTTDAGSDAGLVPDGDMVDAGTDAGAGCVLGDGSFCAVGDTCMTGMCPDGTPTSCVCQADGTLGMCTGACPPADGGTTDAMVPSDGSTPDAAPPSDGGDADAGPGCTVDGGASCAVGDTCTISLCPDGVTPITCICQPGGTLGECTGTCPPPDAGP